MECEVGDLDFNCNSGRKLFKLKLHYFLLSFDSIKQISFLSELSRRYAPYAIDMICQELQFKFQINLNTLISALLWH